MATNIWEGGAPAVAQVSTASIDSVDATPANNTFTVTIDNVAVSVAGITDVATTAAALLAALQASTDPRFAEITWTNPSGGTIVGTGPGEGDTTPGKPFTAVLSETGAGSGAVTDFAATTAPQSPNHWSVAANWSLGAVPTASDAVVFRDSSYPVKWGLTDVVFASILIEANVRDGFYIGLPELNADGSATYKEYRTTHLTLATSLSGTLVVSIGEGEGNGPALVKIDAAGEILSLTIDRTTTPLETNLPAVHVTGMHADSVIYCNRGTLGVSLIAGQTSGFNHLSVGRYLADTDATIELGSGVTQKSAGTVAQVCGTVTSWTSLYVYEQLAGSILRMRGTAAIVTMLEIEGTVHWESGGNLAAYRLRSGGLLDCRRDNRLFTVTEGKVYKGAKLYDPKRRITHTVLDVVQCRLYNSRTSQSDVELDLGANIQLTVADAYGGY